MLKSYNEYMSFSLNLVRPKLISNERVFRSINVRLNGRVTFLKLLILVFHFTLVIHILSPKPRHSLRHLKLGIQDFHMNYVLVPADKAANNVVVV